MKENGILGCVCVFLVGEKNLSFNRVAVEMMRLEDYFWDITVVVIYGCCQEKEHFWA